MTPAHHGVTFDALDDHPTAEVRSLRSPYDGAELATVRVCDEHDVEKAVVAAGLAMQSPMPAWERAAILDLRLRY